MVAEPCALASKVSRCVSCTPLNGDLELNRKLTPMADAGSYAPAVCTIDCQDLPPFASKAAISPDSGQDDCLTCSPSCSHSVASACMEFWAVDRAIVPSWIVT